MLDSTSVRQTFTKEERVSYYSERTNSAPSGSISAALWIKTSSVPPVMSETSFAAAYDVPLPF